MCVGGGEAKVHSFFGVKVCPDIGLNFNLLLTMIFVVVFVAVFGLMK